MSEYFGDCEDKYPELVIEIIEYFDAQNREPDPTDKKTILKFCEQHKVGPDLIYQPQIVSRICKRLCEHGRMECLRSLGAMGINDNYLSLINTKGSSFKSSRERLKFYFNSMVYGFDYIYRMYKDLVVPFVWEKENGDYSAGTGFKFMDGIVTTKHCITGVKNLQIKGYKASDLAEKTVYISDNDGVDLAFIQTGELADPLLFTEEGEVMQEVLVLGYPKIPAFTDFLTAEKATISSKASSRITPTKGNIAAFGYEYLSKFDAMLITAKVRGGNSGGPVINQNGCLVGVACQIPDYSNTNGEYDDLGYGVAVPVGYVTDIIVRKPKQLEIPTGFYRDFVD